RQGALQPGCRVSEAGAGCGASICRRPCYPRKRLAFVPRIPLHRAHHAATLLIAATLLPGCPCGTKTIVFSDDFEQCSEPCGWSVEGGGSADVTSTIHMGEHGLHLTGAVVASKPIQDVTVPDLSIARLSLVTDCRTGLDVLLTTSRDGGPAEDTVALFT